MSKLPMPEFLIAPITKDGSVSLVQTGETLERASETARAYASGGAVYLRVWSICPGQVDETSPVGADEKVGGTD